MLDLQGFGSLLLNGAQVTVKLSLTSLCVGLVLGLLGATAKLSHVWVFRKLATLYTSVMRGIPELLLLLFLYYGGTIILSAVLGRLGYHQALDISAFWAGVMALSIAFGAYATEVFRMAILEVPKGQWEAAEAIGMRPFQTFYRIILPQVWQLALPGLGNLFLVLLKDTALVSVVGLHDIMYHASRAAQTTQQPFTFYLAAALIYLGLTVLATGILMGLESYSDRAGRYARWLKRQDLAIKSGEV